MTSVSRSSFFFSTPAQQLIRTFGDGQSSRRAKHGCSQKANEGQTRRPRVEPGAKPSIFLSTVQIGFTLISILLGAVSGPMFSIPLAGILKQWPLLEPYADSLALGIVVVVITGLSLVVGELVPKRLALHNPERSRRPFLER